MMQMKSLVFWAVTTTTHHLHKSLYKLPTQLILGIFYDHWPYEAETSRMFWNIGTQLLSNANSLENQRFQFQQA